MVRTVPQHFCDNDVVELDRPSQLRCKAAKYIIYSPYLKTDMIIFLVLHTAQVGREVSYPWFTDGSLAFHDQKALKKKVIKV